MSEQYTCPTCGRRPSERGVLVRGATTDWRDTGCRPCPDACHDLADRLVAEAMQRTLREAVLEGVERMSFEAPTSEEGA